MNKYISLFLVCFLISIQSVSAQSDSTQPTDLTANIQKRYESLKSFQAEFIQRLTSASSHETQERKGTILFSRPHFVRWETTSPEQELLIIGQNAVWDYFPEEQTVYRSTVEQVLNSKTMLRFLSGEANMREDFHIEEQTTDGEFQRLKLVPKEPEPNLVEGEIWVYPGRDLLEKIRLKDFFGNINEVELHNLQENVSIVEDAFTLTPPKDTEVVEQPK